MRRRGFNKKNIFLKKSTWLVIVAFIVTLIAIPSFETKAEGRQVSYQNVFKILNIDPGANAFTLDNDGNASTNERVVTTTAAGRNVQITRISMAEYISMVDQIQGQYDAVVIGRNNTNLKPYFSYYKPYRDYTAPFSQEFTNLYIGDNTTPMGTNSGTDIRNKLKYYSAANDTPLKNNQYYSGYLFDFAGADKGKTFIEYYSENDITKKRAKELIAMLNSGELVYFADEILDDSNLTSTNLVNIFKNDAANYSKIKTFSGNNISVNGIVSDYNSLDASKKRPQITELNMSDDDSTTISPANRNMTFSLTVPGLSDAEINDMTVSLYLDINADGIFKEMEFQEPLSRHYDKTTSKCNISFDLDKAFIGYLDWKVELKRSNGVKSYVTNHSIFKGLNGSLKKISVAQIYPVSGNNLSMDTNTNFQKWANDTEMGKYGYDIDLKLISTTDFNNNPGLADSYDMLIVGFGDSYGNGQLNADAVKKIDEFRMQKEKALMLTHDTVTLNTFGATDANWDMACGPKLLGQKLRDIVGQSRYKDNYSNEENVVHDPLIPQGTNGYNNGKRFQDNTPYRDLNGSTLYSMGATTYINQFTSTYSGKVRSVNEAQISNYPYQLGNASADYQVKNIDVALTHTQWFQLNLEDEDIVPWYNLAGGACYDPVAKKNVDNSGNFDHGDSRNYYYTYSKGNITYSGTGHSNNYSEQEFKLFVNTIIKTDRSKNIPPTITNYKNDSTVANNIGVEIANNSEVSPVIEKTLDYNFISIPRDIDSVQNKDGVIDKLKVTITANGQNVIADSSCTRIPGEKIDVTIPKSIYQNMAPDSTIQVVTTVEDKWGAKDTKTFNLRLSNNNPPQITNYDSLNNEITASKEVKVNRAESFIFKTKLTDQDNDLIDAKITLDGQEIATFDDVTSGNIENVTIPSEMLMNKMPGDQLTVLVTATDTHGAVSTKDFKLVIYSIQCAVLHGPLDSNNQILNGPKNVDKGSTNKYGGLIYIYSNDDIPATVTLDIDTNLQVVGDVTIERQDKNKVLIAGPWKMQASGNEYTYSISKDLVGEVPTDGLILYVSYSARIIKPAQNVGGKKSYDNPLFLRSNYGQKEGIATVFTLEDEATPDLY
jgi:hypothetical protein